MPFAAVNTTSTRKPVQWPLAAHRAKNKSRLAPDRFSSTDDAICMSNSNLFYLVVEIGLVLEKGEAPGQQDEGDNACAPEVGLLRVARTG